MSKDETKTIRYRLPPELSDGVSVCFTDDKNSVIDALGAWIDNGPLDGESVTIKAVEMTDEEYNNLPEL